MSGLSFGRALRAASTGTAVVVSPRPSLPAMKLITLSLSIDGRQEPGYQAPTMPRCRWDDNCAMWRHGERTSAGTQYVEMWGIGFTIEWARLRCLRLEDAP